MIDTRVLGRPDKWDGSEKASPNWSFVTKAYAGAIDQQDDMSQAEISMMVLDEDSMSPEAQAKSVQLYFILIVRWTALALRHMAGAWKRGVCSFKRTLRRTARG